MSPLKSAEDGVRHAIKKLLVSRGITQAQLAKQIGRYQPWLSRFMRGHTGIDLATVERIADAFGVTVTDLIGHADSEAEELLTDLMALGFEERAAVRAIVRSLGRDVRPRSSASPARIRGVRKEK